MPAKVVLFSKKIDLSVPFKKRGAGHIDDHVERERLRRTIVEEGLLIS
jgi:hypothetical protein